MVPENYKYVSPHNRNYRWLNKGLEPVAVKCNFHKPDDRIIGSLVMLNVYGSTKELARKKLVKGIGKHQKHYSWGFNTRDVISIEPFGDLFEATTNVAYFSKRPELVDKIECENIPELFEKLVDSGNIRVVS